MSNSRHIWPPDDWEDYCDELCRERHGSTGYVRVPDRDRGDLGLEGYSIDGSAVIYQCYATDEVDVGKRYEKQRDKMTKDLGKLVRNADRVAELLGNNVMKYWALLVPVHDSKDLIAHARGKEQEMRARELPFLADDFKVLIYTEADFSAERAVLDRRGIATIPASAPLTDEAAVRSLDELKAAEPDQVRTMAEKLRRAKVVGDIADLRERLLRQVVDADNIRDHLRISYPSTSERLLTQLEIEERAVLLERGFNQLHQGSVVSVRERLSRRIAEHLPSLVADDADRLAHGQVGRWLLECPLDFPDADA
jgi:hypothetical protein